MNGITSEFNVVIRDISFNMQVNTNKLSGYLSVSKKEKTQKSQNPRSQYRISHLPAWVLLKKWFPLLLSISPTVKLGVKGNRPPSKCWCVYQTPSQ